MKTKARIISTAISAAILMTACSSGSSSQKDISSSDSSQGGYVDVSETQEKLEKEAKREVSDTVEINDRRRGLLDSGYNFNGSEFMIWQTDEKKKIDLATGHISSFCDITGCAHDENTSEGCLEFQPMNSPVMTSGGCYYTLYTQSDCKKLFYKSGGEDRAVFENTYYSDLDAKLEPDHKGAFGYMFRDGVLYIMGQNWFYTVDAKTMKQMSEPVLIGDSPMWYADVSGEHFYMTNENYELWHYDMKTHKLTKLDDKAVRLQATSDGVYYNKYLGDHKWTLYRRDLDGQSEKQLIENVGVDFFVTDKTIYCTKEDGAYIFDKASGEIKKINLELTYENGEKYTVKDPTYLTFVSCSSSQYVYVPEYSHVTGEKCYDALFKIKKDTADYEAISLGIWYQPEGQNGSIISY